MSDVAPVQPTTGTVWSAPIAEAGGPSRTVWLLSFADLVSLLLTFFVMMFAMSTVANDRWWQFVDGLAAGQRDQVSEPLSQADGRVDARQILRPRDLSYVAVLVEQQLRADPLLGGVFVERWPDRLVVSLPGDLLFAPDRAELARAGQAAVARLTPLLNSLPNRIELAGHTDPQPSRRFPSNWELSLARAASVAQALAVSGYAGRPAVSGHGSGQFSGGDGPAQRRARRVDIVITEAAR
ncbi:MAG: flagellar motor protein MotB [Alphaproteobacteria bacterium]